MKPQEQLKRSINTAIRRFELNSGLRIGKINFSINTMDRRGNKIKDATSVVSFIELHSF